MRERERERERESGIKKEMFAKMWGPLWSSSSALDSRVKSRGIDTALW